MQVQEGLKRFRADTDYFDEHRHELLERLPEQGVAVYNREIIGAAKDIKGLIRKLERKVVDPGKAYCEYLTEKPEVLILVPLR